MRRLVLAVLLFAAPACSRGHDAADEANDTEQHEHDNPRAPGAHFLAQRAFPAASIPRGAFAAASDAWRGLAAKPRVAGDRAWQLIGPAPLDLTAGQLPSATPGSGRATSIAIHPTSPSTIYLGTAMGGVWRSDDAGGSWRPLTDTAASLATGSVVIDPAAPDTVYVGTGEGSLSGDSYFGAGLMRSTDGGKTWTTLGADVFSGASITKILLARGAIYVATVSGVAGNGLGCGATTPVNTGLFKSTDAGQSWKLLLKGDVVDVELDPAPASTIALVSRTTTGVVRFDESDASEKAIDLPTTLGVRIELARAKTDPNVVYAGGESGLMRSSDRGVTFSAVPNAPAYCKGQCWYDNVVEVDPLDAQSVYVGGSLCVVQKVSQAASVAPTVTALTIPGGSCADPEAVWTTTLVHPDVHAIAFDPTNPRVFYVASDGGIAMTDDLGAHWSRRNEGIATNQFYHLCVDANDSSVLIGGMQDNGSAQLAPFPGSTLWNQVGGGDGAACVVNLKDPERAKQFVLTSSQFGSITRTEADGRESFVDIPVDGDIDGDENFVTLLSQDPSKPTTVYTATARVFRSTEGAKPDTWVPISPRLTGTGAADACGMGSFVTAIGVGPNSPRIYTGSSGGHIFTSPDNGATWTDVTRPPLPNRWVTAIVPQASDPNIVYAAFSGFGTATPAAPGHIFRSLDAGTTWSRFDVGADPLDMPVDALRVHPQNANIVYAGTDLGVMATVDGGNTWGLLAAGLPNVAAYELLFHEKDSKLIVGTHGRSAWALKLEPVVAARESAVTLSAPAGQASATSTLTVRNGELAGSVLDYTLSSDDAPWLSFAPAKGRASGLIENAHTITATVSSLSKGTHTGTIVVRDGRALAPDLRIPVTLTVD